MEALCQRLGLVQKLEFRHGSPSLLIAFAIADGVHELPEVVIPVTKHVGVDFKDILHLLGTAPSRNGEGGPQIAAGRFLLFIDRHRKAPFSQGKSGGKTSNARADHNGGWLGGG